MNGAHSTVVTLGAGEQQRERFVTAHFSHDEPVWVHA